MRLQKLLTSRVTQAGAPTLHSRRKLLKKVLSGACKVNAPERSRVSTSPRQECSISKGTGANGWVAGSCRQVCHRFQGNVNLARLFHNVMEVKVRLEAHPPNPVRCVLQIYALFSGSNSPASRMYKGAPLSGPQSLLNIFANDICGGTILFVRIVRQGVTCLTWTK